MRIALFLVLALLATPADAQKLLAPSSDQPIPTKPLQQPQSAQQQTAPDERGTEQAPLVIRTLPPQKTQAEAAEVQAEKTDKSSAN
jgi:hypothetical protein